MGLMRLETLALTVSVLAGCAPHQRITVTSPALLGSMQWFGYYWSAADTDYIDEVKDHSNFVFVATSYGDWFTKVQHAESDGLRVILDVHDTFFNGRTLLPSASYQANWGSVLSTLGPAYQNTILAFYPYDEPCHNGVNTSDLYTVAQVIKGTIGFENTPVMMVEAYDSLSCSLPANFDWFGFDCYVGWSNCDGYSIPNLYETLKSAVLATTWGAQKLVILPPSATLPPTTTVSMLGSWLDDYVNMVQADGMTVAMMPWIWQDTFDGSNQWYGDRDSANASVQQSFKLTAAEITGKNPNPVMGAFTTGSSGLLYYSNGQFPNGSHPAYCSYWNSTELTDCGGDQNQVPSYPGLPSMMSNDGLCTCPNVPAPSPGSYRVPGDDASLYYASASAWCAYGSMTTFEQCTDLCDANHLSASKPWGLTYQGYCSACVRTYPTGAFKTCAGQYFYSNGTTAFCECPNTPIQYSLHGTTPAGQSYAGICGSNC